MTERTVGVSSQLPLTDRQPEVQQIRAPALGRWFRSPSALAGISYGIAWVAGLAAWPSNLAIDASKKEIVSIYAAHTSQAAAQYLLVEGLAGLLLGAVLFYSIRQVGLCDRTWTSRVAVMGGVVVAISLLQCLLGLYLVSAARKGYPSQSGDIYQLINRLDGVKQLGLSVCILMLGILLRKTSAYPRWLGRTTVILGVALIPSGLAYLLLWDVLASTTFVSLPVLILWVASTGIWLGAESQRRLHAEAYREVPRLYLTPGTVLGAIALGQAAEKVDEEWSNEFDLLRADQSMYAPPDARQLANKVQDAYRTMVEDVSTSLATFRAQFNEYVQPAIQRLADAMAHDADVR